MNITVLRLAHRPQRDKRITTHVFLTARAFGADKVIYTGVRDEELVKGVTEISEVFGGKFSIEYANGWRRVLEDYKNKAQIIHLTMYGLPIQSVSDIKSGKDKLIIVGGQKVDSDMYEAVDYNIAVTNQPHSEVAALSITLDRILSGAELDKKFDNAKQEIMPSANGKRILEKS